ncbi:MAG: translation elongation factor Ts [Bdellovibrionales bacterium]|nr:translation elongation factor Ts [Bdellovibrionales bacterium]NQZ18448.1 translation elongation factor Ts [Bdellovibrionales bacterium]
MAISAQMVKELRERTSAGMLDCKKALEENGGDFDKAADWLRTKGLSKAAKKSGRVAAEGTVTSYIHAGGRIGVLLEINSETDFVARNDDFKSFTTDIAMHIAATAPLAVSAEEISADEIAKEKEILTAKNREEGKKEEMIDKIVGGQIKKWLSENCLLEQKYVKNPDITVSEHLKNTIAHIGENLVIRRFARFELGEGLEKKQENFADEVAAAIN